MKTVSAVKRAPETALAAPRKKKDNIFKRFWKTRFLFVLFLPTLIYYIMFHYIPMWGVTFAFYDYDIIGGIKDSAWVGIHHFKVFFESPDMWMITRNTLALSLQSLFISFPAVVIFALLLNEIRNLKFKKVVQTVSYLPHFLSVVVVCGLINNLLSPDGGGINQLIELLGGEPIYFMIKKEWFRPIWLISELWASLGWGTIIYLAAISSVDPSLYEAARLDGANRFRQIINITVPSIMPTIATMFILKVGHVMDASMEKAMLLSNPTIYEVSEIISTYVFTRGLNGAMEFSYSTAVSLYKSLVNLALLLFANWASKKATDTSVI